MQKLEIESNKNNELELRLSIIEKDKEELQIEYETKTQLMTVTNQEQLEKYQNLINENNRFEEDKSQYLEKINELEQRIENLTAMEVSKMKLIKGFEKENSGIKEQLKKIDKQKATQRKNRGKLVRVALVGYTNAGKSTLLNRLAKSEVYVANQLFATLDPTTRRVQLPGDDLALVTDTVGFIQKLPTALVAAFHATLEEIAEADLLLHIVDISHPNALGQFQAVQETLAGIDAAHIPMVTALNKADRLNHPENAREILENFPKSVAISALTGTGIPGLLYLIHEELFEAYTPVHVRLPYKEGALISLFHELGLVERVEHERGGVVIQGRIPGRLLAQFSPWQAKPMPAEPTLENVEDGGMEEV